MPTAPPPTLPDLTAPPAIVSPLRVLDVEKRRVVTADRQPSDAGPTCDILIIGGGTGGVAAAEAAAWRGLSVIIVEPTNVLGGQLTAQCVPVPDENRYIENEPGPSTSTYRALRQTVRAHYAALPNLIAGREQNIGSCWVSRISGTPDVWEAAIRKRLDVAGVKRIYLRHQIGAVGRLANGRFNYADIVDLESGKVTRIGAQFMLDASEDGAPLDLAGCPTVIGQESKETYDEAHAPLEARPDWVQSFTYCFAVRWNGDRKANNTIVEKPAEYDYFKSLGEYTLDYVYSERGTVRYKMLETAEGSGGPFWTYRRLVAASNFTGGTSPDNDIALINWRGNDFHEESYLDKTPDEQARILERGKNFALGFLYWLRTECPRDKADEEIGYPELQLLKADTLPGMGDDGFAVHPYIRESRRLRARFTLTETHLTTGKTADAKWGVEFGDSVGCGLYAIDIHPSKGEPPLLLNALPFHIPLGAFLTRFGPANVLPAAKNIGASRLASAAARMHPTEWLIGEVAGNLASFCLQRKIDDPAVVRETPELLRDFQQQLKASGITLNWRDIL